MSNQVVPNTESYNVAAMAIAWEIVKQTYDIANLRDTRDNELADVTNAVLKSYNALTKLQPIDKAK